MTQRVAPVYRHLPNKTTQDPGTGRFAGHLVGNLIDGALFFVAVVVTFLLAWVMLRHSYHSWTLLAYFIPIWAMTAYLALPRIHASLTSIYVPHYFIGRTQTGDGLLGDPVNLALDGTAEEIHQAMRAGGWVQADPINAKSTWKIIWGTLARKPYPEAPVSSLYLFDRQQDFAYQMEVDGNPAQRHHVRFWKCPDGWLLPGGARVDWLAAGTYDRAVGFSLFTLQVTHKIDENIDIERDYIVDSVLYYNAAAKLRVLENFSTGYHSRNGGGDVVTTDGNLPVLGLDDLQVEEQIGETQAATGLSAVADSVGRRPMSVVLGIALTLVIFFGELFVFPSSADFSDLERTVDSEAGATLALLLVGTVLTVAALNLWLAWRTFQGHPWSRRWLVGLTAATVFMEAPALGGSGGQLHFVSGLVHAMLGVLVIYALTSTSAQEWHGERQEKVALAPAS